MWKDGKVEENYYRRLVNAYNKAYKKIKISQKNSYKRKRARMNMSKVLNQFGEDMVDLGVLANMNDVGSDSNEWYKIYAKPL